MVLAQDQDQNIIYRGTNDAGAIQYSIDQLENGGTIYFETAAYSISTTVYLQPDISLIGNGEVTFNCFNGLAFTNHIDGYSSSTLALATDANPSDTSLELQDTTGLNVNDHIKISDTTNNGEIVRITAINNKTISIDRPLYDGYTNANVRKITMFENFSFENIDFKGYGIETSSVGIRFYGTNNITVTDCSFSNFSTHGISLWDSLNTNIENNAFSNIFETGMGYSISLYNACDDININNNTFLENGRHYIAAGSGTGSGISAGKCRNISITDNIFESSTAEAINTHPGTRAVLTITGNTISNCDKGIELSDSHSLITGNTIIDCNKAIHMIGTGNHIINNNTFRANLISCELHAPSTIRNNHFDNGGYIKPIHDVVIDSNTFVNYNDAFIYYDAEIDNYSENVTIINNVCTDELTKSIILQYFRDVTFDSNQLVGGIESIYNKDITFNNNSITSPWFGIRLIDAAGEHTIINNDITSDRKGVLLDIYSTATTENIWILNNNIDAPAVVEDDGYPTVILGNSFPDAIHSVTSANIGETIYLSTAAEMESYAWDFDLADGIGPDTTGNYAEHSYDTAGVYTVTLIMTDSQGTTHCDTVTITISTSSNTIAVNPSALTVLPGETFSANISIDPGVPITGAQLDIISSNLIINSITEGTLFSQAAQTLFNAGTIEDGLVSNIFITLLGQSSITDEGVIVNIDLKAADSTGYATLNLSNVILSDVNSRPAPYTIQNSTILIDTAPAFNSLPLQTLDETQTLTFTLRANDPDADPLTYSAPSLPPGASLNGNTFTWTPERGDAGEYEATFRVTDSYLTDSMTVDIKVNKLNTPPLITLFNPEDGSVFEEATTISVLTNASDADGDELSYIILIDGQQVSTTQNYTWALDYESAGEHTIELKVSDGVNEIITVNTVTVTDLHPRWDVNQDNIVNILDITFLGQNYGRTYESNYPRWDVNQDGIINIQDLTITSAHFSEIL